MNNPKRGFTIVELLIVIVVIAVLAAITIVAFNGIQKRARNQNMVANVTQIYKAINAYVIEKGAYPVSGGTLSCIGSGYPSDPAGLCYNTVSNVTANALLSPYMNGAVPSPPMEQLSNGARGLLMNTGTGNLEFTILGETTCPSVGVTAVAPSVAGSDLWCRIRLPSLNQ